MKEVIATIPEKNGVYFFLNKTGEILYIGKAINLKKRITDHFRKGANKVFIKVKADQEHRKPRVPIIWDFQQKQIEDIERIVYNKERKKKNRIISETALIKYIITENDDEALTLEGCLISAIRPELNRSVWRYPFIEITLGEEVPRILTCYQTLLPDSYIFGPFNIASDIDLAIDGFLRVIPICNGLLTIKPGGRYPLACVREQVHRCIAPCKNIDFNRQEYGKQIERFISELESGGKEVLKTLKKIMEEEVRNENFEAAAIYRDRIQAIERLFSSRTMPTLLKKYYSEIKEIVGNKYNYKGIIDKILENNGKNRF